MLLLGDCLEQMKRLDTNSVDAVVTDPPYGLSFMGKKWDYDVPSVDVWREVFRVLKPGGHVLSFGGTRTYHRMAVNIEDAGFEIRDQVMWVYGSGFPKSCNVSKQLDKQERNKWEKISKAIDNLANDVILNEWQDFLKIVVCADEKSEKSQTEIGMNTLKSGSVLVSVLPKINLEKSKLSAIIAELNLSDHLLTLEEQFTVLGNVEQAEIALKKNAKSVQNQFADQNHGQYTDILIAQCDVRELQNENMEPITKAAEVLMTSLGKQVCLKTEITSALCAALADVLRLTILSRSKSFQNLDTKSQMDFASAITVTTTKFTAENLISFTAGILKSKAIDKIAGAEREVVGENPNNRDRSKHNYNSVGNVGSEAMLTAPATPEAKQWDGWGSALKPANEPICLARKPLEKGLTLAENVLKYGTGAINVDECKIGSERRTNASASASASAIFGTAMKRGPSSETLGRWPANVLFDEEAANVLDAQSGILKSGARKRSPQKEGTFNRVNAKMSYTKECEASEGGASRFFYVAKASKRERNAGLEGMPERRKAQLGGSLKDGELDPVSARYLSQPMANVHPTVKPIKLMEYLITLITPPNGTVLDPFMGSGSTGVACKNLNRNFIGCEMNEEYLEIAKKRIGSK